MEEIAKIIQAGGVGVLATDTLYGIVCQATNRDSVAKIYTIKGRTPSKPFIILIHNLSDLEQFGIQTTPELLQRLGEYWPGPVSIILPCQDLKLHYLHRGTNSLAFRLPAKPELRDLIGITGPLVAPSANPEGLTPAMTIAEAKTYFGTKLDFYVEGDVNTKPSRIIQITEDGNEIIIRP